MDGKRDAQSQRFKNLQYKSRGRGRYRGHGDQLPASDKDVRQSCKETEGRADNSGATNRLGSNWDRYAEPGEADTVDYSAGEEVGAKKRSEGLDYSALLEEADALLRDGAASLLRHFTLDQDAEDPFLSNDPEEQSLPLSINLSALNEGLSRLSLAERLGLEDELFSSRVAEEDAAGPTTVAQSPDKEPSVNLADPPQPVSGDETQATRPPDPQALGRGAKGLQDSEPDRHALSENVPEAQDPSLPAGPSYARNISSQSDAELRGSKSGSQSVVQEKGPPSGTQLSEQSTSGRKEEEDADLLDILLMGNEGEAGKGGGPPLAGACARPAAKGGPLSERGGEGRWLGESKRLDGLGSGDLLANKGDLLDQPRGGEEQSLDNTMVDVSGRALGADLDAYRPAEKSVSSPQQNDAFVPSSKDDIDALLAVLTPSTSDRKQGIPTSRPAATGAWSSSSNGGNPNALKSRPSQSATSNSVKGVGGNQVLDSGAPRMKQQGTEPLPAPPKSAAADQDFDAWLDSLS